MRQRTSKRRTASACRHSYKRKSLHHYYHQDWICSASTAFHARIHQRFEELPGWKKALQRSKATLVCKKEAVVEMWRIVSDFSHRGERPKADRLRGGGTRDWFSLSPETQRAHVRESSEKSISHAKINLIMYQKIGKLVRDEAEVLAGNVEVVPEQPPPRAQLQELSIASSTSDSECERIAFNGIDSVVGGEETFENGGESAVSSDVDGIDSSGASASDMPIPTSARKQKMSLTETCLVRIADLLAKQTIESRIMLQAAREERQLDREEQERDRIEARRDRRDRARGREER